MFINLFHTGCNLGFWRPLLFKTHFCGSSRGCQEVTGDLANSLKMFFIILCLVHWVPLCYLSRGLAKLVFQFNFNNSQLFLVENLITILALIRSNTPCAYVNVLPKIALNLENFAPQRSQWSWISIFCRVSQQKELSHSSLQIFRKPSLDRIIPSSFTMCSSLGPLNQITQLTFIQNYCKLWSHVRVQPLYASSKQENLRQPSRIPHIKISLH